MRGQTLNWKITIQNRAWVHDQCTECHNLLIHWYSGSINWFYHYLSWTKIFYRLWSVEGVFNYQNSRKMHLKTPWRQIINSRTQSLSAEQMAKTRGVFLEIIQKTAKTQKFPMIVASDSSIPANQITGNWPGDIIRAIEIVAKLWW